ncbi:unnamed protein product [Chrysodeixis includens]|uniref:Uncharacterized protein n=1 Tax=Chrysodeixis includens TaxID=689277 RepID=A0A9P0BKB2_CHRIL|nr:unnamed protein product [Chrysodeixis includens]
MKCARLHLQQRSKAKTKVESLSLIEKPRRYCQKRLINPEHEEDPRWIDIFERFHCNLSHDHLTETLDSARAQQDNEDMVLTVQTLKFQGDVEQTKRPRTSFKYKKATDGNKHRMFLKQTVTEHDLSDDDRSSQLTYYFDDYVKYLYNNDRSRPTSSKSSIFLRGFSPDKPRENKAIQVEINTNETKNTRKPESKNKTITKKLPKRQIKDELRDVSDTIENTKVTYQKSGKRKSLTISRNQSPETVQVIRVDVVCNNNSSSTSDYDDKKLESSSNRSDMNLENMTHNYFTNKYNHFANRYLLTNTIKSLDESLSGGAKVTLLCKTFKLSDRAGTADKQTRNIGTYRKHAKPSKNIKKNKAKTDALGDSPYFYN